MTNSIQCFSWGVLSFPFTYRYPIAACCPHQTHSVTYKFVKAFHTKSSVTAPRSISSQRTTGVRLVDLPVEGRYVLITAEQQDHLVKCENIAKDDRVAFCKRPTTRLVTLAVGTKKYLEVKPFCEFKISRLSSVRWPLLTLAFNCRSANLVVHQDNTLPRPLPPQKDTIMP